MRLIEVLVSDACRADVAFPELSGDLERAITDRTDRNVAATIGFVERDRA